MVKCKRFMVLIAFAQEPLSNTHADVPSGAIGVNFGLSLHLQCTYFVYVSSKGSESLHICTDSPEFLLLDNSISTKITCAGSYKFSRFIFSHNVIKLTIML